jgi:hypothetical protein
MAGNKLTDLKNETTHYLGIPYFSNTGKYKNNGDNVLVGKGTAKEIALKTIEFANAENVKLSELSSDQIYNFQKKHHLGIDCSGLACHLLNFYFNTHLDVRKTSADMLTSSPLSQKIDIQLATTGDLVRQKNGRHLLFIIEKINNTIYYIDSSLLGRGVHYGQFDLIDKNFPHQGIFRLCL